MQTRNRILMIAATATILAVGAPGAVAQQTTADEVKCQLGTALGLGEFVREKFQCIENCQKTSFGSETPQSCAPPYSGALLGCVTSAEGAAGGLLQSSCAKDCPECYSGGNCQQDADTRVADAEAHVDALAPQIFCDDSASADGLTLSEFKCQRTVRKFIAKFFAAKVRCFAKCRKSEASGRIAAGSCAQPVSDAKTQECVDKAEAKVAFLIDNKCITDLNPSADEPECAPYDTRDGAAWVAAEEAAVDARLPGLFCNDPAPTTTTLPPPPPSTTTTTPPPTVP
jgi:hypothetical protein